MIQVDSDGFDLKYREFGAGREIIFFIHGFGGSPGDWSEIINSLTEKSPGSAHIVALSIKNFFSSVLPLTFTNQINILKPFIQNYTQALNKPYHFVGQSYGAMLSLGLALTIPHFKGQSFLLNPMPFSPLETVRNNHLKTLLQLASSPGGAKLILRSKHAVESLKAIGRVFHLGLVGQEEIKHFNHRKLVLIEKAIERFLWIDQHEDWRTWKENLIGRQSQLDFHVLYSTNDELFFNDDYLKYARDLGAKSKVPIPHDGHLLGQHRPKEVVKFIERILKLT